MRCLHRLIAAALLPAALAAGAATPDPKAAGERCEAAVQTTLRDLRGRDFASVEFAAARTATALAEDETAVKGEGRYRLKNGSAHAFGYTCSYNPGSGATSGVMLRERNAPVAAQKPWAPDVARVSPAECQSAVVAVLTKRHPRVANIVFDADARALEPGENDATALTGRGALTRAPGMSAGTFRYRCEFDAKRGTIVDTQAIE